MSNFGNRKNQKDFAYTPELKTPRSTFDRSFEMKQTYRFDYINPMFVDEMWPGDTADVTATMFARLTTQIKPLMDRLYASVEWFWVPDRLVWDNQKAFMGESADPNVIPDKINPRISFSSSPMSFAWDAYNDVHGIYNKMGLRSGDPTAVPSAFYINNAKPFRGYDLIYDEWYRVPYLENAVGVAKDDGPDTWSLYQLRKRNKPRDYFTSGLPWPQKGPDVLLPLGGEAPILPDTTGAAARFVNSTTGSALPTSSIEADSFGFLNDGTSFGYIDPNGTMYADLSTATAATVNAVREAFLMQQFFEQDARGGTRYVEIIPNHWGGVVLPDFTAQRSEYLGGGTYDLNIHPVPQSSATGASGTTTPQSNLTAFATLNVGKSARCGFTKSFHEWGFVFGLITFRAAITYQQGNERFWFRSTKFDYPWPSLARLGEQSTMNGELYFTGQSTDFDTFNYQERYADGKYKPSTIGGEFLSSYAQSQDVWHQAEELANPEYNTAFMQQNTPIDRLLVVSEEVADPIQFNAFFSYRHTRMIPTHSIPARL